MSTAERELEKALASGRKFRLQHESRIWRESLQAVRDELEFEHGIVDCWCDYADDGVYKCIYCAPERVMVEKWKVSL